MERLPINSDGLVGFVRARAGDRPLENITAAIEVTGELAVLADHVVAHFVEEARAAGHSWNQIGTSMGMTRQAAQQKYVARRSAVVPPSAEGAGRSAKRAPFSAVRPNGDGVDVQVEIGGTWYGLLELDGMPISDVIGACKRRFRQRWFKRLSEDLDDVYDSLGREFGATADVVLVDGSGRRLQRTVEVTTAKRKAAWRLNFESGGGQPPPGA